ncbi:uncharacterized protein LOC135169076 [Diachasmimorpha longicaudata]|uniref:uncharacterized protein LOC135169076 n=1 Tax=Diachasmimorpha longicaudata TaxID=58733 RepID=UPI0030B8F244
MISRGQLFSWCGILLVLVINSGEALECYQCLSRALADDQCKGDFITQKGIQDVVNCSQAKMNDWYRKMSDDRDLQQLAFVFEVAQSHYPSPELEEFSCLKLKLKVNNEWTTMRTCQSKQTAALDPCKKIEEGSMKHPKKAITVEYCGLCTKDKCNGTGINSATYLATFLSLAVTLGLRGYLHRAV